MGKTVQRFLSDRGIGRRNSFLEDRGPVLKRKILLIFFILSLLVFIGSAIGIGVVLHRYHQADVLYDDLQDRYVTYVDPSSREESAQSRPPQSGEPSGDSSGGEASVGPVDPVEPEPEPEWPPISVDFGALLELNSDVAGWLYCADTPINYPVMWSADNEDYLHRDLNGKYLYSGTPFVDYRCSAVGTNRNHIIYAHNMKNGTMFGTLGEYKEQSYYDAHPVLYYLTPEHQYKIELFSGLVTKADAEVYNVQFQSEEAFEAFLQSLKENSTFRSDVTVTAEDCIVTLSTCSYEFNNARYVVFGKLIKLR